MVTASQRPPREPLGPLSDQAPTLTKETSFFNPIRTKIFHMKFDFSANNFAAFLIADVSRYQFSRVRENESTSNAV